MVSATSEFSRERVEFKEANTFSTMLGSLVRQQSLQLPQSMPMREWSMQSRNQTWIDQEKKIGVMGPGDTPQITHATHMTASIVHSDQPDTGRNQVRQLSTRKSLLDMKPLPYKEPDLYK